MRVEYLADGLMRHGDIVSVVQCSLYTNKALIESALFYFQNKFAHLIIYITFTTGTSKLFRGSLTIKEQRGISTING